MDESNPCDHADKAWYEPITAYGVTRCFYCTRDALTEDQLLACADGYAPPTGARQIVVWKFDDAPWALRALSTYGGDEEWIAWIPAGYPHWVSWIDGVGQFGGADVTERTLPSGAVVRISAH